MQPGFLARDLEHQERAGGRNEVGRKKRIGFVRNAYKAKWAAGFASHVDMEMDRFIDGASKKPEKRL